MEKKMLVVRMLFLLVMIVPGADLALASCLDGPLTTIDDPRTAARIDLNSSDPAVRRDSALLLALQARGAIGLDEQRQRVTMLARSLTALPRENRAELARAVRHMETEGFRDALLREAGTVRVDTALASLFWAYGCASDAIPFAVSALESDETGHTSLMWMVFAMNDPVRELEIFDHVVDIAPDEDTLSYSFFPRIYSVLAANSAPSPDEVMAYAEEVVSRATEQPDMFPISETSLNFILRASHLAGVDLTDRQRAVLLTSTYGADGNPLTEGEPFLVASQHVALGDCSAAVSSALQGLRDQRRTFNWHMEAVLVRCAVEALQ